MRFIILVIDGQTEHAPANELAAIDAFNAKLEAHGHWITAAGVSHGEAATVIDNRSGAGIVKTGSLQAGVEHYSGFWLINAPDHETAMSLASEGSKACNRKVELRPYL